MDVLDKIITKFGFPTETDDSDYSLLPVKDQREILRQQSEILNNQRRTASVLFRSALLLVSVFLAAVSISYSDILSLEDSLENLLFNLIALLGSLLAIYAIIFSFLVLYWSLSVVGTKRDGLGSIESDLTETYNPEWRNNLIQKRQEKIIGNERTFHKLSFWGRLILAVFGLSFVAILILYDRARRGHVSLERFAYFGGWVIGAALVSLLPMVLGAYDIYR